MPKFRYSDEQIEFIRDSYQKMTVTSIVPVFNAAFGLNKTAGQIRAVLKNHNIVCGRGPRERLMPCRLYTSEQVEFIKDNYAGRSVAELTELFNDRFNDQKTQQQIKTFVHNRGITSGRTGYFEKGHKPWNDGKKGYMGPNATSFKKGNIPHTKLRLWSERINRDGFIEISIPERNPYTGAPTRFKNKHVWLWESENGTVPKGHAVIFIDGNKLNCSIENLALVTRAELLSLNLHGYKEAPDELKPSIFALAKMETKAGIRLRPARGRRKGDIAS